jgi:hypothetical protein
MANSLTTRKRTIILALVGVPLLAGLAGVVDMAWGSQQLSFMLSTREDLKSDMNHWYFEDGGLFIGNWMLSRPKIQGEFLGYSVQMEGEHIVPVVQTRTFYRNGALESDTKVFDADGNEAEFYDQNLTHEEALLLTPHDVMVLYWYDKDGNIESESRWENGVLVVGQE